MYTNIIRSNKMCVSILSRICSICFHSSGDNFYQKLPRSQFLLNIFIFKKQGYPPKYREGASTKYSWWNHLHLCQILQCRINQRRAWWRQENFLSAINIARRMVREGLYSEEGSGKVLKSFSVDTWNGFVIPVIGILTSYAIHS